MRDVYDIGPPGFARPKTTELAGMWAAQQKRVSVEAMYERVLDHSFVESTAGSLFIVDWVLNQFSVSVTRNQILSPPRPHLAMYLE